MADATSSVHDLAEREYQQRLEAQDALRRMATSDALTGLPPGGVSGWIPIRHQLIFRS